jgi:hypothetical protein
MPIVAGAGVSYSPLLYRERKDWSAVAAFLRKDAIQPKSATAEDDAVLDDFGRRIEPAFTALGDGLARAELDALILLTADRESQFDSSHIPQIHLQSGGEVWGNPALAALGETPRQLGFTCEEPVAALLTEELVRDGFDIAEARGEFRPVGNPAQGATPAAVEAVARLGQGLPIIPISINCHVTPLMSGRRMHALGLALTRAAALTDKRLGVLVSGGLSGDPSGSMSGWIDPVFDAWVLARIERGRSLDLERVWDVPSRNLLAGTTEVRLWMVAAAALEEAGCRARVHDYLPIHHAAAGIAFASWEN